MGSYFGSVVMIVCMLLLMKLSSSAAEVTDAQPRSADYSDYGDSAEHGNGDAGHVKHTYKVFHFEFQRVEAPFIIGLWIFLASLAKIVTLNIICFLIGVEPHVLYNRPESNRNAGGLNNNVIRSPHEYMENKRNTDEVHVVLVVSVYMGQGWEVGKKSKKLLEDKKHDKNEGQEGEAICEWCEKELMKVGGMPKGQLVAGFG
ncbi:hypothetical protein LSTR_LSTR001013 [Laodelphax striatellus]|uniref:Uncharacterized protein n=1 Tax=Laodelphax striatellus TaxID=195883 RepID=A0A482X1G1_LAOST|nr:hypothetical protein LSTR_LSTR001013 [Laodelphax striatellus]